MITRLVKLSFEPKFVDDFLKLFGTVKEKIIEFPGCRDVQLFRDLNEPNVFFTHSTWESDSDLANYRDSELFKTTWKQTKKFFSEPARAWSLVQCDS